MNNCFEIVSGAATTIRNQIRKRIVGTVVGTGRDAAAVAGSVDHSGHGLVDPPSLSHRAGCNLFDMWHPRLCTIISESPLPPFSLATSDCAREKDILVATKLECDYRMIFFSDYEPVDGNVWLGFGQCVPAPDSSPNKTHCCCNLGILSWTLYRESGVGSSSSAMASAAMTAGAVPSTSAVQVALGSHFVRR